MGLFDKLFGGDTSSLKVSEKSSQKEGIAWIDLSTTEQLDEIVEKSKTKPQFIFKHSTRCGVSRMVISQLKKDYKLTEALADMYYLDLLNHRDISQAIADRFNVVHESPQLLVLKNGVVVKHENHGSINDMNLELFV